MRTLRRSLLGVVGVVVGSRRAAFQMPRRRQMPAQVGGDDAAVDEQPDGAAVS